MDIDIYNERKEALKAFQEVLTDTLDQVISDEQLVDIVHALTARGVQVMPYEEAVKQPAFMIDDKCNAEINRLIEQVRSGNYARAKPTAIGPDCSDGEYDVMTEPFRVVITIGDQVYTVSVVKVDTGELVSDSEYTPILTAIALNTALKEVNGDGSLTTEQIKLEMIKSLDQVFKGNPAFKGIVFK